MTILRGLDLLDFDRKVSDGVGVDGVGAKFPCLQFFAAFPVAEN